MYNVTYFNRETRKWVIYCDQWDSLDVMERMLKMWKERYGENGGKAFPNGKGHYPYDSPHIICMK